MHLTQMHDEEQLIRYNRVLVVVRIKRSQDEAVLKSRLQ